MKKTLLPLLVIICIFVVIVVVHQFKKQPVTEVSTGDTVTFKVQYRGITGKKGDLRSYGGYGFGTSREDDTPFIAAVRAQTENELYISRNPYLTDRKMTAIEYKDKEVLYAYFDLNADGKLSKDEKLSPSDVDEANRRGDDTVAFLTPDFMVTDKQGQEVPFRVILWTSFYGDSTKPNITWSPMGLYEGVAKVDGEKMKFYLFPDFYSKSYMKFASSRYALVPTSKKKNEYLSRRQLSSLIVHDKTFYRMKVKPVEGDNKTLSVSLAVDKSPRGKFAFKIHGKEDFKHRFNNATIRGAEDKTIYFSVSGGMNELPVGEYVVSSGYINYGKEKAEGHSTSFQNVPAFSIEVGKTATIELGKAQAKVQAVEVKNRYRGDKKYKTEFPEGTDVYVDVVFTGMAGETYRSFSREVKKENYTTNEDYKAKLTIVDSENKEVVSEELEYG